MRTAYLSLILLIASLMGVERALTQTLLANGAIVTASITDGEIAEWDFSGAKSGQVLCVTIDTPSFDRTFAPGTAFAVQSRFVGGPLGDRLCGHIGSSVPSQIFVKNLAPYDPKKPKTHSYTIELAIPDGPFDPSNVGQEAAIGDVYNVTTVDHNVDIWRFSAVAGDVVQVKAYHQYTGGLSDYSPWIVITYPDGLTSKQYESGSNGVETAPFGVPETGTYIVFVYNNNTITSNSYDYAFSVNGASASTPSISLTRNSLTSITATGFPQSSHGTFSYFATPLGGQTTTIPVFAKGGTAITNPNLASLIDPPNPTTKATPSPGGLALITATYNVGADSASDNFKVPTFGVSCYTTSLETDWGEPPQSCQSIRYGATVVFGTVTNPSGLNGTFCNAFINDAEVQGSAILADGTKLHYDYGKDLFSVVDEIVTSQQTVPVAGKTVAKDPKIIPGKTILVDVDGVGSGLMATDSFGKSGKGYRLDLYGGLGKTACANYHNPIAVSACTPATSLCPSTTIK